MKLLKELLGNTFLYVKCFATKEMFKTLYKCCSITASCKFLDPKVAGWLHHGSSREKTFHEMVSNMYNFILINKFTYYIKLCYNCTIFKLIHKTGERIFSTRMFHS